MDIISALTGAAYKGGNTTKTTGDIRDDRNDKNEKEKRFSIDFIPKKRVVYSFVTDRNRFLPRTPRLYRAYIVKRPLLVRQTTENAQGRQSIPYADAFSTFPSEQLLRDHTIAAQPVFYYQEPNEQQQLTDLEEPLQEETFPEVPEEFSGTIERQVDF